LLFVQCLDGRSQFNKDGLLWELVYKQKRAIDCESGSTHIHTKRERSEEYQSMIPLGARACEMNELASVAVIQSGQIVGDEQMILSNHAKARLRVLLSP
jgi:hypothetical protein